MLRMLCFLALAGWLIPAPILAAFVPATFEARRTATPPVIDGDISESTWDAAQVIDKFYVYRSGGTPAASAGVMRMLWDDQFLYLAMAMEDAVLLSRCLEQDASDMERAFVRFEATIHPSHGLPRR